MKRYLAFAVVLILLFTSVPALQGYATDDVDADIAVNNGLLGALGIMSEEELSADLSRLVPRAEFTATALRMLKTISVDANRGEPLFTDVPESHYYHDILVQAAEMGIIGGNGNGTFEPDNPITLGQACKILLYALGYNKIMDASGNTITECYKEANRLKLLRGLGGENAETIISLNDAYQMIFNALHTEMCETDSMTADGVYTYKKGETVLKSVYNIDFAEGVAEADYYYSLSRLTADENELIINGITYNNVTDTGFVGYRVRCYYYDDGGTGSRTSMYTYKLENEEIEIKSADIADVKGMTVEAYNDKGKLSKYVISGTASVIYNGELLENTEKTKEKLKEKSTVITMINNDNSSGYDVVFINHYKNMFVSGIDRLNNVIICKSADSDSEKVDLNYYEKYLLISEDGKEITADGITENSIISVCIDEANAEDKKEKSDTLLICVSSKSTTDIIKEKNDRAVVTEEGAEIIASESAVKGFADIPFDTAISIYYDIFGEAAYYTDGETKLSTGYLIDIADGLFGSVKIKMFDKVQGVSEYEMRDRTRVRMTSGAFDELSETEFYKYVNDNGLIRVPVLFNQNSANEIVEMWFLSDNQGVKFHKIRDDIFEDITTTEYSSLFIYKSASRGFMAKLMFRGSGSEVMVVPKEGTVSDEEGFYQMTTPSYFKNGARFNCGESGPYKATPISMHENGFMTDILVWEVNGNSTISASSRTDYGIITEISETWNEEKNEEQIVLEFTSYSGTASSLVYEGEHGDNNAPYDSANELEIEVGDIVSYALDARGNVTDKTMTICYDESDERIITTSPINPSYRWDQARISTGEILQRDGDFLLLKAMRAIDGSGTSIECHDITSANVYTYDVEKRMLLSESTDKIAADDKFVLTMANGVISMVIYYE